MRPYCTATLVLRARQPGVVAGLDPVAFASLLVDPAIDMYIRRPDGSEVAPGETIAKVCGPRATPWVPRRRAHQG
ncbi:hypothetical protein [Mesorhizobium sp. M0166]|uniref:hypothetical protein n=1 Tax=Mesorhizobium sp. M0166 TaxID=2956902 RepID=UPI0033391929